VKHDNVDTDVIIRIERIAKLKRGQFGPWAFEALRYRPDGTEDETFTLNQEKFRNAQILISGANFGCGSSREMAVWAIEECGIRCIIAESFGDIFFNNCFQNGLLPITLSNKQIENLSKVAESGATLTVSLQDCQISSDGIEPIAFQVAYARREALLSGLDEIGQTLKLAPQIKQFQSWDKTSRPWAYIDALEVCNGKTHQAIQHWLGFPCPTSEKSS
jgi:3-isopropylmalate/(R)-2-methylmalate dehydratase small subunit